MMIDQLPALLIPEHESVVSTWATGKDTRHRQRERRTEREREREREREAGGIGPTHVHAMSKLTDREKQRHWTVHYHVG